jgi:hypothetical protein
VDIRALQTKTFLAEHYWPDATADTFRGAVERLRASVDEMARTGDPIRFLHSTFVPEEQSAFCVFSAPTIALVEETYRRAGIAFERVLTAFELEQNASPAAAERRNV